MKIKKRDRVRLLNTDLKATVESITGKPTEELIEIIFDDQGLNSFIDTKVKRSDFKKLFQKVKDI